jgi:hypothetical protein
VNIYTGDVCSLHKADIVIASAMSAFGRRADINSRQSDVRFWHLADIPKGTRF